MRRLKPAVGPVFAALAAGAGGLLVELAAVRRLGLAVGNTAEVAALVVGVFLLGLGVGGLWVARSSRLGDRGVGGAAVAYAVVALLIVAGEVAVRMIGAVPPWLGLPLAILHPGVAAFAMGIAFPLLFGGRTRAAALVAANLLGSVAACAVGGNYLIPEFGIVATHRVGAACYAVAALAAICSRRSRPAPVASGSEVGDAIGGAVVQTVAEGGDAAGKFARRLALLSGLGAVGLQILLLRRMPFFLEGFQPTFAGVVAACLLAGSAGAAFGPRLVNGMSVGRPPAERGRYHLQAAAVALLLGGVASCLGLHEHFAGSIARTTVTTELGMHARIWIAALLGAGPACLCYGAVVPLALGAIAPVGSASRPRCAGGLFFAQGLGSLAGGLLVGHLIPTFAPQGFFVVAPVTVALLVIAYARPAPVVFRTGVALLVVLLSVGGIAGPGRPWAADPPVRGSRFDRVDQYRYLAHRTDATVTASVVYDRSNHSMVLFTDEFRAAYTGADTAYMKVLGHLPFLLRDDLRDVAVIALGTGTTADAVSAWPDPQAVHVVEISPAVLSLVDWFAGDGPVAKAAPVRAAFLADPRTEVHVADGRYWLTRRAGASLDLITMEPLLPYAPGTAPLYSAEFYELASSRLREDGLLVQWVPTHAMPGGFYATLLATFGAAFEHTSVWLVDQSTLLVGSATPHLPSFARMLERLRSAPPLVRRTLHEAGLATLADLEAVHLGTRIDQWFGVRQGARELVDDRPSLERIGYWSGSERLAFYSGNLAQLLPLAAGADPRAGSEANTVRAARLHGLIARARGRVAHSVRLLDGARALRPDSVLLHHEQTLAWRDERERRAAELPAGEAAKVARRQLERDESSASLYLDAARAEADERRAAITLSAALAVDPRVLERRRDLLVSRSTAAFRRAARNVERRSPLEDLAELPSDPNRLLQVAIGTGALAVGIRSAYPVRVARAAVEVAADKALPAAAVTLRSCFDPHSLDRLAEAVANRSGDLLTEVAAPFWRTDLPMPRAFSRLLVNQNADLRVGLAEALAGHRGPRAIAALAELLEDPEVGVRTVAGTTLFRLFGRRIPYDPIWPENRLRVASQALRRLQGSAR